MNLNIKTKNFELTPSIRTYIEEKVEYIDRLIKTLDSTGACEMNFEAGKESNHHNKGAIFYAEANLKVPGKLIRVKKTNEDLHAAIDEVKQVLAEEVKEYKETNNL